MNITSWGRLDEAAIIAFEQKIGFPLPEDYRNFLLGNNGAKANRQVFFVKDLNQDVMLDVFFGITHHRSRSLTLGYWLKELGDEIGPTDLLIGSDPGGRFLLYATSGEEKGVYYWDNNHFFAQSSEEEGNTYFVADSFAEFCDSLMDYTPAKL
ncbi:SMI1/KNR4 family protein [Hymenobacter terrenus]|uniref:SMI1/KNR4 family protein n=1 Tax=Hymenobacter terrenus TaxID=1629124 RepID=UPI00061983D8|nr:SMI1/KNR4 family protein [Hymenobacter terrenus]